MISTNLGILTPYRLKLKCVARGQFISFVHPGLQVYRKWNVGGNRVINTIVDCRKELEWRGGRERYSERKTVRERREGKRQGAALAGESPSLDSLSLNRTPSRYGARVVTQSHPGLDALTLSHALAFPRKAVSHRHLSIAISPHLHRRRFTAVAPAAAAVAVPVPFGLPPRR